MNAIRQDASTYTLSELVNVVEMMTLAKKKLEVDITTLKATRRHQTELVFEKIFAINPKQANLDFIDFEDSSKSFSDRINCSRTSLVSLYLYSIFSTLDIYS